MEDVNALSELLNSFLSRIDGGFASMTGLNTRLMHLLVVVNIVISTLYWLMSNEAAAGFVVKKILTVSMLVWFVTNWDAFTSIVFDSFYQGGVILGGGAIAETSLRDPGSIARAGVEISLAYGEKVSTLTGVRAFFTNIEEIAILGAAFFVAMVAFFAMALQLFFLTLIFHIGALIALIVMPFAVLKQSAWIAERPVAWVFASGLRLAALVMVLSLSRGVMLDLVPSSIEEISVQRAFACIVACGMLLVMAVLAPRFAGDLIAGNPTLGFADAVNATRGIAGTTSGAARSVANGIHLAAGAASGGAAPAVAAAAGTASQAAIGSAGSTSAKTAGDAGGRTFASAGGPSGASALSRGAAALRSASRTRGRGESPSF